MQKYELETIMDYLEEYIEAKINDMVKNNDEISTLDLSKKRKALANYLEEIFEVEDE